MARFSTSSTRPRPQNWSSVPLGPPGGRRAHLGWTQLWTERRARILLTIATCALATSAAAQVPAPTTAFDGTYVGVSRTFEGDIYNSTMTRTCLPNGQPQPLTIAGGVARVSSFEGSVNGQGVLVMRANGTRIDAQIDGGGTVTGRYTGYCSYQMVWQKSGK
jgi:hypothetical protein